MVDDWLIFRPPAGLSPRVLTHPHLHFFVVPTFALFFSVQEARSKSPSSSRGYGGREGGGIFQIDDFGNSHQLGGCVMLPG